ncbi:hypothetical protein RUND412_002608 [Rhizina undulata]
MNTPEDRIEALADEDFHREKGYMHQCHLCQAWTAIKITRFHSTAEHPWTCEDCRHIACGQCNLIQATRIPFTPEENPILRRNLSMDLIYLKIIWKCENRRCRHSNNLGINSLPVTQNSELGGDVKSYIVLDLANEVCLRCDNVCEPESRKTWIFVHRLFEKLPRCLDEAWLMKYREQQLMEEMENLDLEQEVLQAEGGAWSF